MKRDWDVIREVLIEVEALSPRERGNFHYFSEANEAKTAQARLLCEAGFLEGNTRVYGAVASPKLTWAGYDLLDTLRSKPVWERIKKTAQEKGIELTFDAVKALGKAALAAVIGT